MKRAKPYIIASIIFVLTFIVYWTTVPHAVNTVREFRDYFDSDGEFIVRQFRQEKTYTHNDHLLYHIGGKFLYNHGKFFPGVYHDPVKAHKLMSSLAGAAGVAILFLLGIYLGAGEVVSLSSALFMGGCAGWWFFSSTIDTYMPCLAASILALGAAVLAVKTRKTIFYACLGAMIGLAFLLRTDSFLLVSLGLVLFADLKRFWKNAGVTALAGIIVGGAGYCLLAHAAYDVAWKDIYAWAFGSLQRPEAQASKIWGVTKNITGKNAYLVIINQLLYTECLPDLDTTRDARFYLTYVKGAWITVSLYLGALIAAVWFTAKKCIRCVAKKDYQPILLPLISILWLLSRILFYTWWDPFDPFLFAVMSLPALWIILILGYKEAFENYKTGRIKLTLTILLCLATAGMWSHNIYYLIAPIRELCSK